MSALDSVLIDNVITGHDGFPDYLACCLAYVEFGIIEHRPACSVVAARGELAALRKVTEAARAVFFSPYPMSSAEYCNARAEVRVAIAEYDKCRAA